MYNILYVWIYRGFVAVKSEWVWMFIQTPQLLLYICYYKILPSYD